MKSLQDEIASIMTQSSSSRIEQEEQSDICPYCHGSGYELYIDEEGIEYGQECRCGMLERRKHDRLLRFAEIPAGYEDVKLSNFRKLVYQKAESRKSVTEAAQAVKYWLDNLDTMLSKGIGLYFYSHTKGSGKTRLAISIANELIEKHHMQVKFSTSIRVLGEIKRTWNSEEEEESDLLDSLAHVSLLIIDDFGAEQVRGWINEKFYSIINERYIEHRPTIFTSNARLDDLAYDDRIISRIVERTIQIPLPEESVRESIAYQIRQDMINAVNKANYQRKEGEPDGHWSKSEV